MNVSRVQCLILALLCFFVPACNADKAKPRAVPKITVTTVQSKTVTLTQQYACKIESHHHIQIRAEEIGYLDAVNVKEGQTVTEGDVLFRINYKKLFEDEVDSKGDVLAATSKRQKARANVDPAAVALGLDDVKAPFDGMVGRLPHQQGSLVQKGETLTTLSDDGLIWAYFDVSESRYLEFKAAKLDQNTDDLKIELVLANGKKFDQIGKLGAIEAVFKPTTGSIRFRADFPNPNRLLRRGLTGTVLISRLQLDAIVVPQRATFEDHKSRYVYIVDKAGVAHRREIAVQNDLDNLFVVKSGVISGDKIVLDGALNVREGDQVE
jgi:membrane fusion protein (multidrug efflux system)